MEQLDAAGVNKKYLPLYAIDVDGSPEIESITMTTCIPTNVIVNNYVTTIKNIKDTYLKEIKKGKICLLIHSVCLCFIVLCYGKFNYL